jgi:signal peptidase I
MSDRKEQSKKTGVMAAIWRDLRMIIIIVPLALLLKSNTVELFKIPTGSMEPTLYGAKDMGHGFGDHILVLRFAYGLSSRIKVPFANWHLPLPKYRLMVPGMRQPLVGEVVVFENPVDTRIDYIKRCAGTPGDRVRIEDGKLYVNDQMQTNTQAQASYVHYTSAGLLANSFVSLRKTVDDVCRLTKDDWIKDCLTINGDPYREIERTVDLRTAGFDPMLDKIQSEVTVPAKSFFMLGDNSAFSQDSRYWGFVPEDLVKGRAWLVYLPFKRVRVIN